MNAFLFKNFLSSLENDTSPSSDNEQKEFISELKSIKIFFGNGHEHREVSIIKEFFECNEPINFGEMKKKSIALREKGNLIMRNKKGDISYVARLYTEAILAAPKGSEELAFAHANRSLALIRLGYLESAYDDCLCALEEGYPVGKKHKVILRQAELAKELRELKKMKQHISELEIIQLETSDTEKLDNLRKSYSDIESKIAGDEGKDICSEAGKPGKSFEAPFKIVEAVGDKQSSLVATKPIKKGETIFFDYAFAFVCQEPGAQVCNNCADTMIVPFPCIGCSGAVVYCSLKCKQDHAALHMYECSFVKKYCNDDMKMCLPLRMLLNGLPELLPCLKNKRDAQSLWSECFTNKKMNGLKYAKILQSRSCWNISENARTGLRNCMYRAEDVVVYLKNCTKFFECLSETAASAKEWKIFIAAICLRHLGQLDICSSNQQPSFNAKLNRLSPRVEKGRLSHMLDHSTVTGFFPTLFSCKHQCSTVFESELDGRVLRAVATKDINVGAEINDSYLRETGNYMFSKAERQRLLMKFCYFKCECAECKGSDKNFKKFNQFWCQNSSCRKSYSPDTSGKVNGNLKCNHCGTQQDFNCEKELMILTLLMESVQGRAALFDRFFKLQRIFKGCNINKFLLIGNITYACLESHFDNEPLKEFELEKLHEMNICMLEFPTEVLSQQVYISVLCDVIALRGKKIPADIQDLLMRMINKLETKSRLVFLNYYEDFILALTE